MKTNLTQPQRIITAVIYLAVLTFFFYLIGGNFHTFRIDVDNSQALWFVSGALLIVLGKYIAEPFFTKPTDSLANSIAVIIAIRGVTQKETFLVRDFIFWFAIGILIITLLAIALNKSENEKSKILKKNFYWISTHLGSYKVLFSLVFLASAYTSFGREESSNVVALVSLIAFWVCLIFFDIIGEIVVFFSKFQIVNQGENYELGRAIGCENPFFYKVEIDNHGNKRAKTGQLVTVEIKQDTKAVGIIIGSQQLLNKKWLLVYMLTHSKNNLIISVKSAINLLQQAKSILKSNNSVFPVNSPSDFTELVEQRINVNILYTRREEFIGFVEKGTDLNTLRFHVLNEKTKNRLCEGAIVSVYINGKETLYQLIDGLTLDEHLEHHDSYGYTLGIARKLGNYNQEEKELEIVSWLPEIFNPVFLAKETELLNKDLKEIADNAVGRLPKTKFQIPIKDIHSIVTHNTAILGILGIGKSRLTFELLQKLIKLLPAGSR